MSNIEKALSSYDMEAAQQDRIVDYFNEEGSPAAEVAQATVTEGALEMDYDWTF